jgi:hypothetical protein
MPDVVAHVIYEAVQDGATNLRYAVGADAEALVEPRTGLTMNTRRGKGYYKVPSLREDYFAAADAKPHAVKGHEFSLKLSPREKSSPIAFLRTL